MRLNKPGHTESTATCARHFADKYADEHVAGNEFVIEAMFVAWGV